MANTLPVELVPDTAADVAITVLQDALSPLRAYTSNYSDSLVDPMRDFAVGVVTGGSTTLTNPTNFEQGDGTVTQTTVTMAQLSQPFHITNAELQVGHKLERLMKVNLHALANKINDLAFAPIVKADFTTASIVAAASTDLDSVELKALWAAISNAGEKNLVLQGDYYAEIMPSNLDQFSLTNGAYGFDTISYNNRFSEGEAGLVGFAANPQALVAAARLPETTPAVADGMLSQSVIDLPELGLSVQFNMWAAMGSRKTWASFDVCFGAAKADTSALIRLTNVAD